LLQPTGIEETKCDPEFNEWLRAAKRHHRRVHIDNDDI
jgi:hypothetical protein